LRTSVTSGPIAQAASYAPFIVTLNGLKRDFSFECEAMKLSSVILSERSQDRLAHDTDLVLAHLNAFPENRKGSVPVSVRNFGSHDAFCDLHTFGHSAAIRSRDAGFDGPVTKALFLVGCYAALRAGTTFHLSSSTAIRFQITMRASLISSASSTSEARRCSVHTTVAKTETNCGITFPHALGICTPCVA